MAQTIRTGEQQVIALLAAIAEEDPDAVDNEIIQTEEVRAIAKRRANLDGDVKRGFATLYNQCSQDVKDKLEASEGWVSHPSCTISSRPSEEDRAYLRRF